jgi:hypothetical protein
MVEIIGEDYARDILEIVIQFSTKMSSICPINLASLATSLFTFRQGLFFKNSSVGGGGHLQKVTILY